MSALLAKRLLKLLDKWVKKCQLVKDLVRFNKKAQFTHDYEVSMSNDATKYMTTEYSDVVSWTPDSWMTIPTVFLSAFPHNQIPVTAVMANQI